MSKYETTYHEILLLNISKARRRWRFAFAAIYSIRAMLSLAETKRNGHYNLLNFENLQEDSYEEQIICTKHDQKKLIEMVKNKDKEAYNELGEAATIAASLGTNPENGIKDNGDVVNERRQVFGSNTYHKRPPKSFFYFVVEAFKDTTILILLVCAALALGFGIKEHGVREGWYEGGSIFVAVALVVVVSAISNFRQEIQFEKLSKISNNIKVEVLRDGRRIQVSIFDIVVGDVAVLKLGDQIPADGLFLSGHSLQVDESSMTGESDHVELNTTENPFLLSGTKVVDGYGHMLVTSVGMDTAWGEMMSSISRDSEEQTPLQVRLNKLTTSIGKVELNQL